MARIRRPALGSRKRTVPGEYVVRRAEEAHAQGYTYKEIANQFNMNERTLRKLRTGETSGRKLFPRARDLPGERRTNQASFIDSKGDIRSINLRVQGEKPRTRFDSYRIARRLQYDSPDPAVQQAIQKRLAELATKSPTLADLAGQNVPLVNVIPNVAPQAVAADVADLRL